MSKKRPAPRSQDNPEAAPVLAGVLACLTGMQQREKEKLHGIIQKLGGSYTRDFDPDRNTHLVAKEASGAKYDVASEFPSICIVSPAWLEETWRDRRRLDEADYALLGPTDNSGPVIDKALVTKGTASGATEMKALGRTNQFSACHFFLAGWSEYDEEIQRLSSAIRKNWGTIYWDLDFGRITHVIVKDHAVDERTRNAALSRPSGPVFVSPSWVVSSLRDEINSDPRQHVPKASKKKSAMFESCAFRLHMEVRGNNCVDFDEQKLEKMVTSCGGRMMDARANGPSKEGATTFFDVRCGSSGSSEDTESSSSTTEVTPLWLMACEAEGQIVDPKLLPQLFLVHSSTTPFPWNKFPNKAATKVSITGFAGPVRAALALLLRSMGGIYHDSLRTNTTHLICGSSSTTASHKYKTALLQNSVHVVTLDWLLAVLKDGDAEEELYGVEKAK